MEMSKKIKFHDDDKLSKINGETIELYTKYKRDMKLRELSEKTISQYDNDLSHWFLYIYDNQNNKCIKDLTDEDIEDFLLFCKDQGNNSRRMKRRTSSISAFYKFLRKKKIIKENPCEFICRPKKDVDVLKAIYLTKEQIELMQVKLDELCDTNYSKYRIIRLYAMFAISTMARVNAISHLKWEQIDFKNRECNNVLEKEGYLVTLYFSEKVKLLLEEELKYRQDHGIYDNGYVFFSTNDGKTKSITNGTMNAWCKIIGEKIGEPELHTHSLRKSGATFLKNEGVPLEEVSELLNHKSTDVTKRHYIKEDKTKLKDNKDKFGL